MTAAESGLEVRNMYWVINVHLYLVPSSNWSCHAPGALSHIVGGTESHKGNILTSSGLALSFLIKLE